MAVYPRENAREREYTVSGKCKGLAGCYDNLYKNQYQIQMRESVISYHVETDHVPDSELSSTAAESKPRLTYCAITTNDQSKSVPFCPKRLNKIAAMGWPIELLRIPSVLVSMQKAREILMASSQGGIKST